MGVITRKLIINGSIFNFIFKMLLFDTECGIEFFFGKRPHHIGYEKKGKNPPTHQQWYVVCPRYAP
jgi:hypothetical protein